MVSSSTELDGSDGFATEEIRAELERVLASDIFRSAPQLAAFLTYVVEQTLAGRAGEVKGYTIAVEAFGRPAEFDPQADPIVRVEAGRLRKALNLYFAAEGIGDPVRIAIPVGGYVPVFERVAGAPAAAQPFEAAATAPGAEPAEIETDAAAAGTSRYWLYAACVGLALGLAAMAAWYWDGRAQQTMAPPPEASAAVAPVAVPPAASLPAPLPAARVGVAAPAHLPVVSVVVSETTTDPSLDDVTRNFVRHLVDTMARFDDLVVVKSPGPLARPAEGADYILALSASRSGGVVEGFVRLSAARDGRVVWTTSGERGADQIGDGPELREAAQRLAIRLAQPFGVIHADARNSALPPESNCIFLALNFRRTMKAEEHLAARTCLEGVLARDPEFHPAWSQLALLTLDEYASGLNARAGPALDRALAAAVAAVRLAPSSARAHQAMMDTLFLRGAIEDALKSGREALARNPYDPDVMADLGARYVQLNRPAEGLPLLDRAIALSSGRPPWYDFYMFLAAYLTGATKLAEAHAALIQSEETPLSLIGRAMAAAASGDQFALDHVLRLLKQSVPLFDLDARLYLSRRGFSAVVSDRIVAAIGPTALQPR